MEYSGNQLSQGLQSPTTNFSTENSQSCGDSNSSTSNEAQVLSPSQYGVCDDKQYHQFQSQSPSLNQLLQSSQCGQYGLLRPPVSSNYWNVTRQNSEISRQYCTPYEDGYTRKSEDASYSKVEILKSRNDQQEDGLYHNNDDEKSRLALQNYKHNDAQSDVLNPKESEKKIESTNANDMSDIVSLKPELSHLNTDYNPRMMCSERRENSDVMYQNSNYPLDSKISQSQWRHDNQVAYENVNYGQMMSNPNANYHPHLRYPSPTNGAQNYTNANNNPMLPIGAGRHPVANYAPYMQTPGPGPGCPPLSMPQTRQPFNMQAPYTPRGHQSSSTGQPEIYMNGSIRPQYGVSLKEAADRKDDSSIPVKQEPPELCSRYKKSATNRLSSKSKNVTKSDSHPATPVTNTIPSPSQTSVSSIVDDNEDSVSSLGPNDTSTMYHPVTHFNQQSSSPSMPPNLSMMYPQPYLHNNQVPPPNTGLYSGHSGLQQQRPYTPSPNMMPARQYSHQNDLQINNSCFPKLLELGSEPERGPWVERYLKFMQENNTPLIAVPTVVKQTLDLFRLYHAVRDRGGLLNVVKTKRWKEICNVVNVNASASGAYTLRRNYIKCLLDFECRFDRNGVDPSPILQEIQSLSDKKKKSVTKTTGSSSSSSTVSAGLTSQHNMDFGSNPTTPRPLLPPSDFSSSHPFPGHSAYNSADNNATPSHRNATQNPTQRSSYVGPFASPRMLGTFSTPSSAVYPQARYDANMSPNWCKPNAINQQQWPSSSSSSNSNSTHPMQLPMSPGTSSNSVSNSSQQSQQNGDDFEVISKDGPKIESSQTRFVNTDNVTKTSDNSTDKVADKAETSTKSDANYPYNHPYQGLAELDGSYEYFNHGKNLPNNVNQSFPPVQYPAFPFARQYGSSIRQSAASPLSYSSYFPANHNYVYPPGTISNPSLIANNSHHVTNGTSSQYYPMASFQENARRMDWKSNYGGMPPPKPPPPNGSMPVRGPPPPNMTNTSQLLSGPHSQYHSSMPHCNYQNQIGTALHKQRPNNPQLSSSAMLQNKHLLESTTSHLSDQTNSYSKSFMAPMPSNGIAHSGHGMSYASCHNRSQIDPTRSTQSYPSQLAYTKSGVHPFLKQYEHLFPRHCVEVTQPDYSKKRKYCSKDIKPFNVTTVTMGLKSGLVAEVSLALNCLNVWSRDDSLLDKLSLKNAISMFHALVDVWRHSLATVFGRDTFIRDLELPASLVADETSSDLVHVLKSGLLTGHVARDIVVKESRRQKVPVAGNNESVDVVSHLDDSLMAVDVLDSCENTARSCGDNVDTVVMVTLDKNGCCGSTCDDRRRAMTGRIVGLLDSGSNGSAKGLAKKIRGVVLHSGKNGSIEVTNGHLDDKLWSTKEGMVKMVGLCENGSRGDHDCVTRTERRSAEYKAVRNGLSVASGLDTGMDSVCDLDKMVEAVFGEKLCKGKEAAIGEQKKSHAWPHLRDLWKRGWSDTSMHILPPVLSQGTPLSGHRQSDVHEPRAHKRPRVQCSHSADDLSHDSRDVDSLFFGVTEADEEKMLRCVCVSLVVRNLSFISGNDRIMGTSRPLLSLLSRLVLLGHEHSAVSRPWWVRWADDVREHVMVTMVNVASHLELDTLPETIVHPIVAGLLHWLTCQSADAEDPLPSHRVLGCRRLALECLMRLCVHERNIDFVVHASSSGGKGVDSTVRDLFNYLASSFCGPDVQVVKEMALAVMHYLSAGGEDGLGCLYLANAEPSVIGGLITFIEAAECQIRHVVDNMGMEALQARPELMGTSLDFLRHSGSLLARIAGCPPNRARFTRDHETRLLSLVISTVLDQTVAQSISGVLFFLGSHEDTRQSSSLGPRDMFKTFLMFDDLGFCEAPAVADLTADSDLSADPS